MSHKHASTNPAPGQGELLTGTDPNPHFEAPQESGVAYGVHVNLQERNDALRSALSALGHMARGATFQEIGIRQQEGSRSPAVRKMEGSFSQDEFERRQEASRSASDRRKGEVDADFKTVFGVEPLLGDKNNEGRLEVRRRDGTLDELSEEDVLKAARWGGRHAPVHQQGKKEFMERFAGANNSGPRNRYKRLLGRQNTHIKRIQRRRQQRG